jgi:hypothetical protein
MKIIINHKRLKGLKPWDILNETFPSKDIKNLIWGVFKKNYEGSEYKF